MTHEFDKYLESIWEDRPRPEEIHTGQIWTIFYPDDMEKPGTLSCILRIENKRVFVVPLHSEKEFIRGIDPVINSDHIDFQHELIALVDSVQSVDMVSFQTARFIGSMNNSGIEVLLDGISKYQKISAALTRLQFKESAGLLSDEEANQALSEGILELIPSKASRKAFRQFKSELLKCYNSNLLIQPSKEDEIVITHEEIVSKVKKMTREMLNLLKLVKDDASILEPLLQSLKPICRIAMQQGAMIEDFEPVFNALHPIISAFSADEELASIYADSALLSMKTATMHRNIPHVENFLIMPALISNLRHDYFKDPQNPKSEAAR